MTRWAMAALALLLAAHPATGADDPRWKRLEARAADYNARTWVRLRDGERSVWVDAANAGKLKRRNGRPRTMLVLWPQDPETHIAPVGTGVEYTIAETTFHCHDRSATEQRWHFGADFRLMAERVPVREDVAKGDLLFEVVCGGADVRESTRKETAEGVVNYLAAGETDGPPAPG